MFLFSHISLSLTTSYSQNREKRQDIVERLLIVLWQNPSLVPSFKDSNKFRRRGGKWWQIACLAYNYELPRQKDILSLYMTWTRNRGDVQTKYYQVTWKYNKDHFIWINCVYYLASGMQECRRS